MQLVPQVSISEPMGSGEEALWLQPEQLKIFLYPFSVPPELL